MPVPPSGVNEMKMNIGLVQPPLMAPGDLATYLQQMRDQERADLARELHDELGSLLTGAKLEVASLKLCVGEGPSDIIRRLQHLSETINRGISFSRRVVEGLHPSSLTNLGLAASLTILAREFQLSTGIATAVDLEQVELDEAAQLAVYRVVQESLNNTSKYADATDARVVVLRCGSHTVITVRDNGKGFDTAAPGPASHGLAGMHHRIHACGGQFTVSSAPGLGTLVTAVLHAQSGAGACPPAAPARDETVRHQGLPGCKRRAARGKRRALDA